MKIAVLMTCHNRVEKTLLCLQSLFKASLPKNYKLEVFLVDDGSTDSTSKIVQENFPKINIIQGDGNLFWNQGMRLAWKTAVKTKEFDFYLWLNDDVELDEIALKELVDCHYDVLSEYRQESIVTGACKNSKTENKFSYGGRTEFENVIPNGKLQQCKYINGNVVLIPKKIYKILGNLSSDYTHAMGDFDYGLRSIEAGFNNYTTTQYVAICPTNFKPQWSNPNVSLKKRLKLFQSPRGLNYKEYIIFRKKFWGNRWIIFAVKAYVKVLFPSLYDIIKI